MTEYKCQGLQDQPETCGRGEPVKPCCGNCKWWKMDKETVLHACGHPRVVMCLMYPPSFFHCDFHEWREE